MEDIDSAMKRIEKILDTDRNAVFNCWLEKRVLPPPCVETDCILRTSVLTDIIAAYE